MNFRIWLHEIWLQNCDEHREYGQVTLTQEQYFQMYKYWLKREYRYQQKNNNDKHPVQKLLG